MKRIGQKKHLPETCPGTLRWLSPDFLGSSYCDLQQEARKHGTKGRDTTAPELIEGNQRAFLALLPDVSLAVSFG